MKTGFKSISTLVLLAAMSTASADEKKQGLSEGAVVPAFTLRTVNSDLAGKRLVSIDDYFEGGQNQSKALVMSFFATYCKPCKKELPFLQALYENYKDQGLSVFVVSIDREQEKVDELKQLANEHKLSYPVLWDRFNIVAKRYGITKLPCLYLITPDKKVSMVNIGYNKDISPKLLSTVRKAIGVPEDQAIPENLKAHMQHEGSGADENEAKAPEKKVAKAEPEATKQAEAAAKPEFNEQEKELLSFLKTQIYTVQNKCKNPRRCFRAIRSLNKRPLKKSRNIYRRLKRKGNLSEALKNEMMNLQKKRDQVIADNPKINKNKRVMRFINKYDKAIGL